MSKRGEVLIAILNDERDFAFARDAHWYRIPISSAQKWLKDRWPPEWLSFYHTKKFGEIAYSVRYYARVLKVREVFRYQILPNDAQHKRNHERYYQLILSPLQTLPTPIFSRRWRRITFIPTTWEKFIAATEINDLYDESPLEDRLWAEFKRRKIFAERQEFLTLQAANYALDFAIRCAKANVDVETDGDTWHANPEKAAEDNRRDNALEANGWKVLRFTTHQIMEQMSEYTIPTVVKTIKTLGGVDEGGVIPRQIDADPNRPYQLGLFDDL
jgi:very-short-patch-repair endonuclease